jgi:hypothetical protein
VSHRLNWFLDMLDTLGDALDRLGNLILGRRP